ncbi:MAG: FecCD family ABC transporter permease [Armatimonadota bacterium]
MRRTATLLLILIAVAVAGACVGTVTLSPVEVLREMLHRDGIVWGLRVPRVLLAALVGASLALAGTALQALLLNPLADPYMVGVSSGAATGAGVAVLLGLSGLLLPVCAFVSALLAVAAVYTLARKKGQVSALSFILAGVSVGAFMWAALTFLLSISPDQTLDQIVFWTMGSFAAADPWKRVLLALPFPAVGLLGLWAFARELNIFALGEESAAYLGVKVERLKCVVIALTALVTAGAVSVSGTIGFVGLMVPHITRRIVGPDNRVLIPSAALIGAAFMIAADALARTVLAPSEVPVGVVTALLGAPFFLYLLRRTG